jgi:hypothetical protein
MASTRRSAREKQRRAEKRAAAESRARRQRLVRGVGLAVGAVAVALLVLNFLGVFEPPGLAIDLDAPQYRASRGDSVGTRQPAQAGGHVDGAVTYSTDPPTSGPHSPRWEDWGIRDSRAQRERTTHNLEHGGIVIAHNGLTGEQVDRLKALVRTLRRSGFPKMILQPYPELRSAKIAVTAWQWLLELDDVDDAQIVRFVKAHYQGPEAPEPNGP